jgi:enoyl-CoA hydratase/carnithine racemase
MIRVAMMVPDAVPLRRDDEVGYYVEDVGYVRRFTINRPERANSLSIALEDALMEECLRAGQEREVRVFVVTGTGEKVFCAGGDIKEMSEQVDRGTRFGSPMNQDRRLFAEVLLELYKPTIAVLNGTAVGGGLELALACDIRIAAPHIRLGLPEARRGLAAIFGSVVLPRLIPVAVAMEMMFTGEYIAADTAERFGLVNRIVAPDRLMLEAMELASRIAESSPVSVRRMKEMAMKGLSLPVAAALRLDVGPDPYTSADRGEGISAFLEKRQPNWVVS